MKIVVLDVGTSSLRGILYSREGQILDKEQIPYHPVYLSDHMVEQDANEWKNAMMQVLRAIVDRNQERDEAAGKIGAVVLTAQRTSVVPVDQKGEPLRSTIMWQDVRNAAICEDRKARYGDRIREKCAFPVNTISSAGKMTWIRENCPECYRQAYRLMVPAEFLVYHLTGNSVLDSTYASRSLLMNLQTCQWDEELLEIWNVEKEKLARIIEPGSICGYLTEEAALKTHLEKGIPVLSAGGDQQCGAVGQGVFEEGVLSITCGTGAFLCMDLRTLPSHRTEEMDLNRAAVPGHLVMESTVNTCTAAFDWYRREFLPDYGYDEINAALERTPQGAHGVTVLPYFQGRSTPDWNADARGAFLNLTLSATKEDFLRALLEGICCEIRNHLELFESAQRIRRIYAGGGLCSSSAFCRMLAEACGREITVMRQAEATAGGAWMSAAVTLGLKKNLTEAFETLRRGKTAEVISPEEDRVKVFEKRRQDMNFAYKKLL